MQASDKFPSCACRLCREECKTMPGWFTPEEALQAIAAGYGSRLAAVTQKGTAVRLGIPISVSVTALAPAICGYEGQSVPFQQGRCTFLRNDGACEVHEKEFKPAECRTNYACRENPPDAVCEIQMFPLWDSPQGKAAVLAWRQHVGSSRK